MIDEYNDGHLGPNPPSISREGLESYLDETFFPYVRKVILQSSAIMKPVAEVFQASTFFQCLVESLVECTGPIEVRNYRYIRARIRSQDTMLEV